MEAFLVVIAFIGGLYYMYHTLKTKLVNEVSLVQGLATKNGWQFVKNPDTQAFMSIADYVGFQANAICILYFVSGNLKGK
jgi:hypothetical protein